MSRRPIPEDIKRRAIAMRESRMSAREIAEELGVSPSAVGRMTPRFRDLFPDTWWGCGHPRTPENTSSHQCRECKQLHRKRAPMVPMAPGVIAGVQKMLAEGRRPTDIAAFYQISPASISRVRRMPPSNAAPSDGPAEPRQPQPEVPSRARRLQFDSLPARREETGRSYSLAPARNGSRYGVGQ